VLANSLLAVFNERIFIMSLWSTLFFTDYGFQSVAVIAFILGMFVWFGFYFKRHIDEDEKRSKK
jgi:hypothetical protein